MKLVIAEKASLAEAISQAIGEGGKKINSNTIRRRLWWEIQEVERGGFANLFWKLEKESKQRQKGNL